MISDGLVNLQKLVVLTLDSNKIKQVPGAIGKLENLESIYLDDNELTELPDSLRDLTNLRQLYLHGNPGLGIPAEVLGSKWAEKRKDRVRPAQARDILEYYFRTKKTERPLNEAKLILVGRGAFGKTSLAKRLIFDKFDSNEQKTQGINIDPWEVPIGGEKIRLNVWDFGGQEIMHATHQFFMTERSLYLLVLNGREGGEDTEAEYWLKLIASFGGNSPVIIVLTKISEHPFDLNRSALQKKYPNIKDFVRTDSGDRTGIEQLKASIFKATSDLDDLRVNFPAEWFAVKDLLASAKQNYMPFEQYRRLCDENGVTDEKDQELLARYLNQLGIVLNYKDDPRLKDTHVLNPHWVTEGIYTILNSRKLEASNGEIRLEEISGIVPEKDYPSNIVRFIFDLMKKFELCFSFPDNEFHYLIPELLPKNEPDDIASFDLEKNLNFQFHYTVLPEGLLPRFITRTHHLSEGEPRWRSGVILQFEDCRALVKADGVEKNVIISVAGENAESRRRLLAVIRADLEGIHRDIKNLDPEERVPLPGLPDDIVLYEDLLVMEKEGQKDIYKVVGGKGTRFKVADLLSGVDLPGQQKDKPSGALNLFYSYSHKDDSLRGELETHLKLLQRNGTIRGWSDLEIGAGENWEDEIMKELERADIVLLLISSDFIASDFCYERELGRALERHKNGEAIAIPIIVRDCSWKKADFSGLQVLPKGGEAVNIWPNKDTAWRSVAEEIEKAADRFRHLWRP
jgi:internalin A